MKLSIFTFLFLIGYIVADEDDDVQPRNYNRSRYSARRLLKKLSTTELPETTTIISEPSTDTFLNTTTENSISNVIPTLETTTERSEDVYLSIFEKMLRNLTECGLAINNDVPWIAVLEHTDPSGRDKRKTLSKGVLIDKKHVLTTVSSIHNTHPFWVVSGIRLGDTPTWMNDSLKRNHSNILSVGIDKVFLHGNKDIAIIRLAEAINITDSIRPICLPINENYNFRELYFHVCKRLKNQSPRKYEIELTPASPISPSDCDTMFRRKGAAFTNEEFCAWDEYGDTCTGDLGGPLMGKLYGKYMVIGLNSYAMAEENFDAEAYPGIYVRVGSYLKWIRSVLELKEEVED